MLEKHCTLKVTFGREGGAVMTAGTLIPMKFSDSASFQVSISSGHFLSVAPIVIHYNGDLSFFNISLPFS